MTITVAKGNTPQLSWHWNRAKYCTALRADSAYLLRSNQGGWTAEKEFWQTHIQLTVVERAFRVLKSELLLQPVWHHYGGRTQAHVMVCVRRISKTLDHLQGRRKEIRSPTCSAGVLSQISPMTPEVILRELGHVAVGDILLETTDGRHLALRRVARPTAEPARILASLGLKLPERLSNDRVL